MIYLVMFGMFMVGVAVGYLLWGKNEYRDSYRHGYIEGLRDMRVRFVGRREVEDDGSTTSRGGIDRVPDLRTRVLRGGDLSRDGSGAVPGDRASGD